MISEINPPERAKIPPSIASQVETGHTELVTLFVQIAFGGSFIYSKGNVDV
ncbi:hypothetical protein [Haloferax sp. ATB1]|uniref:hypothetical protein n=1 Tax=Haloferax sp. ATB1 TaxID=1508454 RepID=UPI0012FF3833|nr:hypothetical protein [Haloferax sp. ATB1]